MVNIYKRLEEIKNAATGYWGDRIAGQLSYALRLSEVKNSQYDGIIRKTLTYLENALSEDGVVTTANAQEAEKLLSELSAPAKEYSMVCTAHAHIDMNWMWGYAETAAITLDTFRTMLRLMDEYPDFTFSQSQASVYKIVELYDKDMLAEIKKRVVQGRWEITATTWVENDKNMPNGESLVRHILYTKKYLSDLFGIDPDSLKLDFQPDTFGHSLNVPEILTSGGVEFYYHCRGYDGENIYNWQAPSGKSVLVYREPAWYNARIDADSVLYIPRFCDKYGIDTALKVYGVGNHGGGPTRRDVEKLIDMASWPVFPSIRFGTFHEYFEILKNKKENFPVVKSELNYIFPGCYTTQTRIKLANRVSEAKLNEAEAFSALSKVYAGNEYKNNAFGEAWEKTLFNQFHDIITGSGVTETREYAMGQFQQTMTIANTEAGRAIRAIAAKIDTGRLTVNRQGIDNQNDSEGAGVGFRIKDFSFPQTERGKGRNRVYHFFNPSPWEREENARMTIWDWPGDTSRLVIKTADGTAVQKQIIDTAEGNPANPSYWGHKYFTILAKIKVPAYGYTTCIIDEDNESNPVKQVRGQPIVEKPQGYILQNELIRAEFDPANAAIISLIDKTNGREMLKGQDFPGVFRLVSEDDSRGMTAWIIGRYMNIVDINKKAKIKRIITGNHLLRQFFSYELSFGNSIITVNVSLDSGSAFLRYDVSCDWQERPVKGKFMPQLNFNLPLGYSCSKYKYDIPFGTIERNGLEHDVPANSWAAGIPDGENHTKGVMLISGDKYGFRGNNDSISLTLIRSSYNPDPYPELGMHNFWFAFGVEDLRTNKNLLLRATEINHPFSFISGTVQDGDYPPEKELLSIEEGNVIVSAVKMQEGNTGNIILRLYETEGRDTACRIRMAKPIKKAYFTDVNENKTNNGEQVLIDGGFAGSFGSNCISFNMKGFGIATLCVET